MVILDVAPNLPGLGRALNPIAGQPCFLGISWGPGTGFGAIFTVTLSIPGASITPGNPGVDGILANVSTSLYAGFNLGWSPDGVQAWLDSRTAAYGIWQVTFPTATTYTITLGVAGQQQITAVSAPGAPVLATLTLLKTKLLGNLATRVFGVAFNGNYPAGGFPVRGSDLGLGTPFFAHINDTAAYRFVFDVPNGAIRVYGNAGEVATNAALVFNTTGLFHGSTQ